jgi:hypothetical protein
MRAENVSIGLDQRLALTTVCDHHIRTSCGLDVCGETRTTGTNDTGIQYPCDYFIF